MLNAKEGRGEDSDDRERTGIILRKDFDGFLAGSSDAGGLAKKGYGSVVVYLGDFVRVCLGIGWTRHGGGRKVEAVHRRGQGKLHEGDAPSYKPGLGGLVKRAAGWLLSAVEVLRRSGQRRRKK